jgi:hypothetical protein
MTVAASSEHPLRKLARDILQSMQMPRVLLQSSIF